MTKTFDKVAAIIVEWSDVEIDSIGPDSHLVEDLKLDSVDLFDVVFALEREFDIELPIEEWGEEREGQEPIQAPELFMKNFCERIDNLVAQKSAA
ncbi:acyl carrier protein [Maritimibacter sp. UBA3975]|uniref:acyl carrier protein n=1 Tax=Maritimibacter sp. UBA3975 TaxID=1946833 RepID=UPI000C0B027C|nr:acyl carrier protein [Maritimibacter sp. UBA3975]MAM60226.1 acyl carrier protein [Maritimibacter sp.]